MDSITVRCRSSAIDAIDVEEDDDDSDEDKASFFCCCSEESDADADTDTGAGAGAEAEASSPLDAVSAISSSLSVLLCFVLFFCFVWLLDLSLYYMYKPIKCPH